LFELCIRVIQDNINDLGFTGGVPYDILKPVLDRASADQLFHIENYNPYLIENTDDLWKFHCSREFRGKQPQELESWRELYTRCVDERKARFQSLTKKVRRKQETATPQMKTKLAYVDTTAGPKFSRSKTETIKNGMKTLKTREEKGIKRTHGSSASAGGSGSSQHVTIEEASVIISAGSKAGTAPAQSREREGYSAPKKPKKAPLMQKTMKIIKTLYRR
jgi:transcription elongation factor B polypeptide 3